MPLETIRLKRHYPSMQNETEATQHFRRAALAARESSRVLAGTSEDQRNSALSIMATSLRDHRVEILAANAADLALVDDKTDGLADFVASRKLDMEMAMDRDLTAHHWLVAELAHESVDS